MKKMIATLLSVLLIVSTLAACSTANDPGGAGTARG